MINKDLNNDLYYWTSDLALSAAISLFYPVKSINRNNPCKVYFAFKKEKDLDSIIERYRQGKLKLDVKSYFTNLKMLKSLIYEK
jgi:hypothetical protein